MREQISIPSQSEPTVVLQGGSGFGGFMNGVIKNMGTDTVFVQVTEEDTTLTTSNGFPLLEGESLSLNFKDKSPSRLSSIYAVQESGLAQKLAVIFW